MSSTLSCGASAPINSDHVTQFSNNFSFYLVFRFIGLHFT